MLEIRACLKSRIGFLKVPVSTKHIAKKDFCQKPRTVQVPVSGIPELSAP
jgi:hypothetical protein